MRYKIYKEKEGYAIKYRQFFFWFWLTDWELFGTEPVQLVVYESSKEKILERLKVQLGKQSEERKSVLVEDGEL